MRYLLLVLTTCMYAGCATDTSKLLAVIQISSKRLECMNEAEKAIDKWNLGKKDYEHFTQMAYLTCRSIYPIGEPEDR